jgi:PAS domain S-box-containing protein
MPEAELEPLRKALALGAESFSLVADALPHLVWVSRPDGTILYYNRRWLSYTGLGVDDTNRDYGRVKGVVHPDDLTSMWARWSESLASATPYETEYRLRSAADGTYRWFIARAEPLRDEAGRVVQWIGTATDVDEQHRARETLEYIALASKVLFENFELAQNLQRLVELLVPTMGEIALIVLLDDEGALRVAASAHEDPEKTAVLARLHRERLLTLEAERVEIQRLREHRARVIERLNLQAARAQLWPYVASTLAAFEPTSSVTIPLHARGETFGGLYFYNGKEEASYHTRDLPLLTEIAHRTSIAIENARSYARERRIAEAYQRASLPIKLSTIPGVRIDAVFTAGSDEAAIGGDWYDSTLLPNGSLLVTVGDVMGRGLEAAAIMARTRQVINVAAMYETDPARVLDTTDRLVGNAFPELMITAFVAIIAPDCSTLRYANAGHRAPFLRRRNELVELQSTGLPLGVRREAASTSQATDLTGAELLVLYTDGLVDDRRNPDVCEWRLHEVVSSEAVLHAHAPARLIQEACTFNARADDIAVLTVRFGGDERWSFSTENAQAANDARADFVRFLKGKCDDARAIETAEVVFGELVGNVVRHAPGPVDVTLEWKRGGPILHIIDRGTSFEQRQRLPSDPLAEGGRGLFIAGQLSAGLKVSHLSGYGNHVSAHLNL